MNYQVGGSLSSETSSYVERQADEELYQALKQGEFCYVLNSRQMGKSSLLVRTKHRLQQEGFKCTAVDLTNVGSETVTPLQWYKGVVGELWSGFNLLEKINLKAWWREQEDVPLLKLLDLFISELLTQFSNERLFIFVDEIDSILSLKFTVDDFFALIRSCYNQRAINPEYNRITFAIFGVATPSELIQDKTRTPFNIGKKIEISGFKLDEAQPLAKGLQVKGGDSQVVLEEILAWTGGQPFLTQKLCKLVFSFSKDTVIGLLTIPAGTEAFWVENVVRTRIVHNWESQDEPEHLKTIRDRLLRNEQRAGRLLGIYQQILQEIEVPTDDSKEHSELLLSGLVVKQQGLLRVRNRIYQEVFNLKWVEKQLASLRPYSQTYDAWVGSKQTDESRLLRGQALQDSQLWAQGKSLSDLDYQFLAASQELDRREVQQALEAERTKEVEARLAEEQRRLVQEKKSAKQLKLLLSGVSVKFLLTCALWVATYSQYRQAKESEHQARMSEVQALTASSEALFASNQRSDALFTAIKAKQQLHAMKEVDPQTKIEVEKVLRQAVSGADINPLSKPNAGVWSVALSPDSQMIATISDDRTVKLWQQEQAFVKTLSDRSPGVNKNIAFSPDSQTIATGGEDNTIKLWKRDGTLLRIFKGHQAKVWSVAFSPNGQMIASASEDSTVKLWKQDGTLLRTLKGNSTGFSRVAFSSNGEMLAVVDADNTAIWKLDGTLLASLHR